MIFGTPQVLAPERALGQNVDARADLYTMGIMLFEMLCGKRPFIASSPVGILGQQLQGPLPRFAQRAPQVRIPSALEQLVHRLLAPAAAARLPSALALVAALEQTRLRYCARPPPIRPHQTPASSGYVPNVRNLLGLSGGNVDATAIANLSELAARQGESSTANISDAAGTQRRRAANHRARVRAAGSAAIRKLGAIVRAQWPVCLGHSPVQLSRARLRRYGRVGTPCTS